MSSAERYLTDAQHALARSYIAALRRREEARRERDDAWRRGDLAACYAAMDAANEADNEARAIGSKLDRSLR